MRKLFRSLWVLCVLCGFVLPVFGVDREAFTFTDYDLNVRVEPEQQRLAVRGKITLRNDSDSGQRNVVLQISSTLDWRSIQLHGSPVQFLSHAYASDVDHSGALTEAIVTLPQPVPPRGTVELEVGYEGVIPLDTTRLTRTGIPQEAARHNDWDQINKTFTAVRGAGYVAWYPVAMDSANLSDADTVDETVGRWKVREAASAMSVRFESTADQPLLCSIGQAKLQSGNSSASRFHSDALGFNVPAFVIAGYDKLPEKDAVSVQYLPAQLEAAKEYASVAEEIDPGIPVKTGTPDLQILGLPDPQAAAFASGDLLFAPLKLPMGNDAVLSIVYAEARERVVSPRAWVQDGLAHYAQAAFIEAVHSHDAALDYLNAHQSALVEAEKEKAASGDVANSLINAPDDLYLQIKAMYVWWMLKQMVGRQLDDALRSYNANEDKDSAYVQRLLEKNSHRDLQWFFDDWVYRDRGLPDFRIVSVYSRPIVNAGYMVTVEVENLGGAGAEVPVTLRTQAGDIAKRLVVPAKTKASIRIEAGTMPTEAVVNDGSVPESDTTNNAYKIDAAKP